jgi:hypothetical protein
MDRENMEETGLAFSCNLLQAASVCDILREHDGKVGQTPTRIYLRKVRVWQKLPGDCILVKYDRLNPAVFPPERGVAVMSDTPTRARKI